MAAKSDTTLKHRIIKELALLAALVLIGVAILPLIVYLVGYAIFGEYGGGGFTDFFRDLHRLFRAGDPGVGFLLLSPYIVWQVLRVTAWAVRRSGRHEARTS